MRRRPCRSSLLSAALRPGLAFLFLFALPAPLLRAFNLSGERWAAGQVTMHLQLGPTSGPLLDGASSWGAVAEDALATWNRALTNLRFTVVRDSTAVLNRGNAINNVFFSPTVYGSAWDGRTIGICLQSFDTRTRRYTETDVLFNSTVAWDSYRGPVRTTATGATLNDFRRVAIHEFGHALGLNHPDDAGQSVVAIMNRVTSDVDNPAADDLAGARAIYDNPNVVPSALLSLQGSVGYSFVGSSLTLNVGSIRNDGDATSGALRLELWATPQPFDSTLPPGAHLLGGRTLSSTLAAGSALTGVVANTTYTAPPNGSYYVVLLLLEESAGTFGIRDAITMSGFLNVGPQTAPQITTQPSSVTAFTGGTASFRVVASGAQPLTYQWRKDGAALPGATNPTLTLTSLSAAQAGNYSVVVTNNLGSATSQSATLLLGSTADPGRLINMSIRTGAGTGDSTLIVGVALGGAGTSGSQAVLFRAVGPTLGTFGVSGALADPVMTLFQGTTQVAQNDDWTGGFDFGAVGAFAFSGTTPRDSAYYNRALASGSYSIQIVGKTGATGVALAEIYDATPAGTYTRAAPRLVNVSARTLVGTGEGILIAGFVVGGTTPVRVLVRAVGPTLGGFGVGGVLADPQLTLSSATGVLADNDNWGGTAELKAAFAAVGAFAFTADSSRDAALIASVPPGSYTAQIRGANATTGVALVEVYELP
ncbi:MAG: immunoglobulin domain-containing protein [Verrucomicrobia bacterium]|nr:immunoglobulin domain-containing protein [Verrucomicrobiota bacterium]